MKSENNCAFIVGAARSGTTAMHKILDSAGSAHCEMEPSPNLNIESRRAWDRAIAIDSGKVIRRDIFPRLQNGLSDKGYYIEKQNSLVPLMVPLFEQTGCKFVIMKRDGRRCVESILNWHYNMYPIFYREAKSSCELSPEALQIDKNVKAYGNQDPFDYSLPRPLENEEYFDVWQTLDRFDMVSYYWNRAMLELIQQCAVLPQESVMWVEIEGLTAAGVEDVYDFLKLPSFNRHTVEGILNKKVNSLTDRGVAKETRKPCTWDSKAEQNFFNFAREGMRQVGYIEENEPRPFTSSLSGGDTSKNEGALVTWCKQVSKSLDLQSVIEVGVDDAVNLSKVFDSYSYECVDSCSILIDREKENCANDAHKFICQDIIANPLDQHFDLVISQSAIDEAYDPEIFLMNICRMAKKAVYVCSQQGYHPKFRQFQTVKASKGEGCINKLSPTVCRRIIEQEGFGRVSIFPSEDQGGEKGGATVIIGYRSAKQQAVHGDEMVAPSFAQYKVNENDISLFDLFQSNNRSVSYYSSSPFDIDDLAHFKQVITDLKGIETREMVALRNFADGSVAPAGNLAIRIDVDVDLVSAVEMAEICAQVGVPASFYILHTAPYYGEWEQGEFQRNECAIEAYRLIQDSGSEVGLHIDAFTLYKDRLIDGSSAVVTELNWLRENGINITGVAAHNCAPCYNAENFEVFQELVIGERRFAKKEQVYIPLGVLSMEDLGIKYEANYASSQKEFSEEDKECYLKNLPEGDFNKCPVWMRKYLLDNPHNTWGFDYRIWHLGVDFWVVAGVSQEKKPVFRHGIVWREVLDFIVSLEVTETVVMVLHPVYFGKRKDLDSYPLSDGAVAKIAPSPSSGTTVIDEPKSEVTVSEPSIELERTEFWRARLARFFKRQIRSIKKRLP